MSAETTIPKFEDYDNRIVAFVDLLGFSQCVSGVKNDQKEFDTIAKLLWRIKTMEDKAEKEKVFQTLPFPKYVKESLFGSYECTALSDSIVFSYSATEYPEYALLFLSVELAKMQWTLLCEDSFLIRGHIAEGKCYHKSGFIFGQAYLDAYQGAEENPIHKLPYITIQDGLLEKTFAREKFISPEALNALYQKDHLDRNFINFVFTTRPCDLFPDSVKKAREFINAGFENVAKPEIKEKYFWTYKYLSKNIAVLKG